MVIEQVRAVEEVECKWTTDTPDACWLCNGEACALCSSRGIRPSMETPCDHSVDERHMRELR